MKFVCLGRIIHRPSVPSTVKRHHQGLTVCNLHPLSRGTVHIQSRDPMVLPAIDPNYLSNPLDLEIMVDALKFARKLAETEPLHSTIARQVEPAADVMSDEDLARYVRAKLSPVFRPVGSVAMLPKEDGGVVDSELIVYGTKNLRVVSLGISIRGPLTD